MSFFKKILGGASEAKDSGQSEKSDAAGSATPPASGNQVRFGRYTDANKGQEQLKYWTESKNLFTEKKYVDSFEAFFKYLGDPKENNVTFTRDGDEINFEITQGSKVIKGKTTANSVSAETNVVRFESPSVPVMRKLMNQNYVLKYSKFAINDNVIVMKFTSNVIDCGPSKMYHALKELATKADQHDDLLVSEFSSLEAVDTGHTVPLSEMEREAKFKYLQKWINDTLTRVNELDDNKDNGAISYLYLRLAYKIDYLLAPEGKLMDEMEHIHRVYFAKDDKSAIEKNSLMKEAFQKIVDQPKDRILESLYRIKATFGIVTPAGHKEVADFIHGQVGNVPWYAENNYPDVALSIYEYTAGYCLFRYGMYQPSIELMDLFMHVFNQDFYSEVGVSSRYYDTGSGQLDKTAIQARIEHIIAEGKKEFPQLAFATQYLKYDSLLDFGATFMKEVDYLNFNTKPNA
jgi:hypothetical protein